MKTITYWKKGMTFESHAHGHKIILDTSVAGGGSDSGFNPKSLLLSSLAGCTGMDIISILDKMKVKYSKLEIEVEAEQTDEHPRVFRDIYMIYRIKTAEKNQDKVEKSIQLSLDKYCGVAAMLRKNSPIHYKLEIEK